MNLLKEVNAAMVERGSGPVTPSGWSVGNLANHGVILSCDGFQLKISGEELQKFFDIVEDGEPGEIKDQNSQLVLVEPTDDSVVLTRTNDDVYPAGVVLTLKALKELGIEPEEEEPELKTEGVKAAYRRSGKKIKKGFRVTSGFRKGRVVANIKTAFKPRAKASTRMKLKIAGRKKKFVKLLKSRRTRKKSLSKRLARMNSLKK